MKIGERAKEIAARANTCCSRSDGFEEEIRELVIEHLCEVWNEAYRTAQKVFVEKPATK